MAKTKNYSVRFDEQALEILKTNEGCKTAQKALSFLEKMYVERKVIGSMSFEKSNRHLLRPSDLANAEKFNLVKPPKIFDAPKTENYTHDEPKQFVEITPMPIKMQGENSIDFAVRKNEWKVKYGQK